MELIKPGLNIILDAQWGSTGKGKLGAWLGAHNKFDYVCSSFGPNAGHTVVDDEGKATVLRFLPAAALTCGAPALIMPDSVIEVETLLKEAALAKSGLVLVHPYTSILIQEDIDASMMTGRYIAGTMKGTGHAMARKMLRLEGTQLAKDVLPKTMIADTCALVRDSVRRGGKVLFEMSQGFDLSLNHGYYYPYCTGRDITVGAALNSCGVSHKYVGSVIGSMRTFPIRVGNVTGGWSGPHYPDQHELTWKDITEVSMSPVPLSEITTITKRVRRVFTFSAIQTKRFIEVNSPDWIFLNFVQYLDWNSTDKKEWHELTGPVHNFANKFETEFNVPILLAGTGPRQGDLCVHPNIVGVK